MSDAPDERLTWQCEFCREVWPITASGVLVDHEWRPGSPCGGSGTVPRGTFVWTGPFGELAGALAAADAALARGGG